MKNVIWAVSIVAPISVLQFTDDPQERQINERIAQSRNAREIITLGDEILRVEESSLVLDSSLAAGGLLEDPSRSYAQANTNEPKILDNLPDTPNGMKLYRFIVPSGGRLNIKLKSESSRIVMIFLMHLQSNPMTAGIRRANMPPASVRRSRIGLQNQTESPQEAVLMLKGPVGIKFSMEIDRSWTKK